MSQDGHSLLQAVSPCNEKDECGQESCSGDVVDPFDEDDLGIEGGEALGEGEHAADAEEGMPGVQEESVGDEYRRMRAEFPQQVADGEMPNPDDDEAEEGPPLPPQAPHGWRRPRVCSQGQTPEASSAKGTG